MSASGIDLGKISIERLRSFNQIVEAGSASEASSRNSVSQAQLSRQMGELEDALGTKLFRKEGRSLRLTRAGIRLSALTNAYFTALGELRSENAGDARPMRLGAAESVVRWILTPRFPEVLVAADGGVTIENQRTSTIVEHLESGTLDVGIIRADAIDEELETLPFATLEFTLMVPRNLLPEKSAAGIKNAGTIPLVLLSGDGSFVRNVQRISEQNELIFDVSARVESFSLAIEIAKVMNAATFVPIQARGEFPSDLFTSVPVVGIERLARTLQVAYHRKTAELNSRAWRFAVKLSRAFESVPPRAE